MDETVVLRGEPHRFRYILCGLIDFDGPISAYRLIGGNNLGDAASCVRFKLPQLFHMTKYSCDSYSTTDDQRSLNKIGYDIMVKINGRWMVRNDLKPVQPHRIYHAMSKLGYTPVPGLGYVTHEQYKKWRHDRDRQIREALKTNTLPPKYTHKYAIVWHGKDGTLDYALDDDDFSANLRLQAIRKFDPDAYIIAPKKEN